MLALTAGFPVGDPPHATSGTIGTETGLLLLPLPPVAAGVVVVVVVDGVVDFEEVVDVDFDAKP
jgi:hypothetical protein